jgi:hypothetical protein
MKHSFFRRLADEQGLTFLLSFLAVLLFVVYPFFSLGRPDQVCLLDKTPS